MRHIESAYFTFIASDEMGNPVTLQALKPENEVRNCFRFLSNVPNQVFLPDFIFFTNFNASTGAGRSYRHSVRNALVL